MKIMFTGPRDIHATQALERALFATDRIRNKTVIVDWNEVEDSLGEDYSEFHFKKKKSVLAVISWQLYLYKKLKEQRPDVIFNMSSLSFIPIYFYSFFKEIKIIYDCRDYLAISYSFNPVIKFFIRFFDNLSARLSYAVIVPDPYGKKYFNLVKDSKLHVIYNSVQDHGVRKKHHEGPIRLAFLGYLSLDRNVKAIFDFVKNNPQIELYIACNYIPEKIKDIIPDLDNIFLHERLTHFEAQNLLSKMDYCLLTYNPHLGNYKYIQPTKFYDCLSLGLPYICSKGMVNLENHINKSTSNIAIEYNSINFAGIKKTHFSEYNSKLYKSTYSYDSILKNYREVAENLLREKQV